MRHGKIQNMLRTIEAETEFTSHITGRSTIDLRILDAMKIVPRDEFVPDTRKPQAFANNALPIGEGQTISQPFIVALMTDLLTPQSGHKILEIGTGSGYQAAILSLLADKVYSLEIVPKLAHQAALRLERLDYQNVEVRVGNGHSGWPEQAPYDGIIITAATNHLPPNLLAQLKPGGRLVIPLGLPYMHQELMLVEKDLSGKCRATNILGVVFVPMIGEAEQAVNEQ
ncbi:MAG TPA: protein-L-isoaspartate(D-aspartate) O-methyltransferase [Geopsychrobacteraceae bacterium]|nr:protein-L-isoaspartate(D-aspartate) O-methyltransferase [Geopsychrobacteraceae bacterium]